MATIEQSDDFYDEFASEFWSPKQVRDRIRGELLNRDKQDGLGDSRVIIYTIDAELIIQDKEKRTQSGDSTEAYCGQKDLQRQLHHAKPQVGDLIDIEFTGEKHVGKASPMKLFNVVVERQPDVDSNGDDDKPF